MPRAACARALLLALLAGTGPALAQSSGAATGADACLSIEVDATRLACYDRALGRASPDPGQADAAAGVAEALRKATTAGPPDRSRPARPARRRLGDFFDKDLDPVEQAIANAGKGSLLDSRWELAQDSKLGTFNFRAYKPVYLLPVFWTSRVNDTPRSPNPRNDVNEPLGLDSIESKFQISFKTKAFENVFGNNGDVWMGYTQSSRWQVFNGDASRPFRETNYEPEVLLAFRTNYGLLGWKARLAAVGINHQSNGRADPLSRSWNRMIFNVGLDRDGWALMLRPWVRISDGNDDDNPGMSDYMGRGDATLVHAIGAHELSLMLRHSLRGGEHSHGAAQFDWGFPISNTLRGHVQVFSGYGESLIDYNHRATYLGLGVSLLEWY